jgi:c-di-GMP-binding flagellar brake protein YcgR
MAHISPLQDQLEKDCLDFHAILATLNVGQSVDLLLPTDRPCSKVLWHTKVIDLAARHDLIVAPSPPLDQLPAGQQALDASVLYGDHPQVPPLRLGFTTTVLDRINSQHDPTVDALVLHAPQNVQRINLRDAYRVSIPSVLDFVVRLRNPHTPYSELSSTLIDLSATGALLSVCCRSSETLSIQHGDPIILELDCRAAVASLAVRLTRGQKAMLTVPSQVLRTIEVPTRQWCHMAVKFMNLSRPQEELFHTLVLKVQQWFAARHQSWGETSWMSILHARQSDSCDVSQ